MKKIFSLAMILMLMFIMVSGVFAHQGSNDFNGGHYVQYKGHCVAYHYNTGLYAGWELTFNKHIEWADRIKLDKYKPFKISDTSLGTWKNYIEYHVKKLPMTVIPEIPQGLTQEINIKVNDRLLKDNKILDLKDTKLDCRISTFLTAKAQNNQIIAVYSGSNQRYLIPGNNTITVICSKLQIPNYPGLNETYKERFYTYNFGISVTWELNYNHFYVVIPEVKPTSTAVTSASPTMSPSVSPTTSPTTSPSSVVSDNPTASPSEEVITGGNNNNTTTTNTTSNLPKTGESSQNIYVITGLIVIGLGLIVVFFYRKKNKIFN